METGLFSLLVCSLFLNRFFRFRRHKEMFNRPAESRGSNSTPPLIGRWCCRARHQPALSRHLPGAGRNWKGSAETLAMQRLFWALFVPFPVGVSSCENTSALQRFPETLMEQFLFQKIHCTIDIIWISLTMQ